MSDKTNPSAFLPVLRARYILNIESNPQADFEARLAQLSAVWYLDWLLNLPVFLSLQAMKEESK